MNSVWYGLAIVAISIVVYWFITNDGHPGGEYRGLLAMKPIGEAAARPVRRRKRFSLKNMR